MLAVTPTTYRFVPSSVVSTWPAGTVTGKLHAEPPCGIVTESGTSKVSPPEPDSSALVFVRSKLKVPDRLSPATSDLQSFSWPVTSSSVKLDRGRVAVSRNGHRDRA